MGLPVKKDSNSITQLIHQYQAGDSDALNALMPMVYDQLKKIATNQMKAQANSHTLSATALVHEAFLKLREAGELNINDRTHFFAVASKTMRWFLTDYARAKTRDKRGGKEAQRVLFEENELTSADGFDPSTLEEALKKLELQDARLCRIVELRFLVGLTIEETAEVLTISPATVKRDWLTAKAWLSRELKN